MPKTGTTRENAGHVTAPIVCRIPWTPADAGHPDMSTQEIQARWKVVTLRPCGLLHGVVSKKYCAYRCDYGTVKE